LTWPLLAKDPPQGCGFGRNGLETPLSGLDCMGRIAQSKNTPLREKLEAHHRQLVTQQHSKFLRDGKKIIISTVQTFPFVLDSIGEEHRGKKL
jgi:hypothetical protein